MRKTHIQHPMNDEDRITANEQEDMNVVAKNVRRLEEMGGTKEQSNLVTFPGGYEARAWTNGQVYLTMTLTVEQAEKVLQALQEDK